jgi:ABC-2 type transport system permease protein
MIADIQTVIWKEWKEILGQQGRVSMLSFLVVLGVVYPLIIGGVSGFFETPGNLFMYIFLPMLVVMGTLTDAFAGERERHTLETLLASRLSNRAILLGKIGVSVLYVFGLSITCLLISLLTINLVHWEGQIQFYPPVLLFGALAFCLVATVFVGSGTVLFSLHAATIKQAYQRMSLVFLIFAAPFWLLMLPSVQNRLLDWITSGGASQIDTTALVIGVIAVFVLADVGLIALSLKRFQRSRMIVGGT